jgi:hypothetical protein
MMVGEDPLTIGIHAKKETRILLSEEQRSRHMHVVGRTGSGKSKLLEWMIREDIKAGRGLLLLDPHGDLYRGVLRWAIEQRLDRNRLLLIDQNQLEWAVGLNYLEEPGMTPEWIAGRAQEGIAKVFGGERQEIMPTIRTVLPRTLNSLIQANLRLSEGLAFITNRTFRWAVLEQVKGVAPELYQYWVDYEEDRERQKSALMAMTNRFDLFDGGEMRAVVGQDHNTIKWEEVLGKGKVVLVNLASERVSSQSQKMLGVIIIHQLISAAKRRPEAKRRRFYAYCDEFQDYITEDFALALEEMRKFQVSFVLAHQHLAQIERAGEWILQSVISQPGIRVVFDPGNRADAEVLARELFTGTREVTGTRIKDELYRTFYEPQIVREDVESRTEGYTSGGSDSWDGEDLTSTSSDSHTESTTRSSIPVTHHKERQELASKTYKSLEEEWEQATAWIMRQPDRHALFHIRGRRPMRMVTPEVEEPKVTDRFLKLRVEKALGASGRLRAEVEDEIQKRKKEFALKRSSSASRSRMTPAIQPHPGLIEQE